MRELGNDRWAGEFTVSELGVYEYGARGWVDEIGTWRRGLERNADAGNDVTVDILIGAALIRAAAGRAGRSHAKRLRAWAAELADEATPIAERIGRATDDELTDLCRAHADRSHQTVWDPPYRVRAERERARFSTWYEMFPRSCRRRAGRHGTFADVEARLPDVAAMGFDVLYLPPIHPIGRAHARAATTRPPPRPATPAARGRSAPPRAGTRRPPGPRHARRFRALVDGAAGTRLEIALDLAFQCSPDHPYVSAHPEWFRRRPDGTVQYAENPPKKYQDIYPFDFDDRGVAPRCGRICGASSASGSTAASGSSAWTTRTPSRSRSGSG